MIKLKLYKTVFLLVLYTYKNALKFNNLGYKREILYLKYQQALYISPNKFSYSF